MTRRRSSALVLLVAGLVSACGSNSPGTSAAPSSAAPTVAPTVAPTTAPPSATPSASPSPCTPAFVANTLPDTGSPVGPPLGLQSANAALQTGYDRVVFTLGGSSGKPGWDVEYVTNPTSDGSGDPVAVAGGSTLQVLITDVGVPGDTGVADPSVKRFTPAGTAVVREVVLDTVFEGRYTAFIGVSSTLPFRVFRLASPARLVVDVRHC